MPEYKEPFIPINLLVLDAVGVVLLGLGLAKQFAGVEVLAPALRFEGYELGLIAGGIILMLPMVLHVIGKIRAQQARRSR